MAKRKSRWKHSILQRFLERVRVNPINGCWEWQLYRDKDGYGIFSCKRVHRVSYELYIGPIPAGLDICHRCDNPSCANPFHLFCGTTSENILDAVKKGRWNTQKTKTEHPSIRDYNKGCRCIYCINLYREKERIRYKNRRILAQKLNIDCTSS